MVPHDIQVGDTVRHLWAHGYYKVLALVQIGELRVHVQDVDGNILSMSKDVLRFVSRPSTIDFSSYITPHYFQD